jgi:glutamyl-tRNA synthetase
VSRSNKAVTDKQEKGYEPEAVLNFLALMGWDHHAVRPSTSLEHPRNDNNSLSELFTMDELIQAFDIKHINHRKAAVDMQKLDFLNKMTLRHKAGRLGDDGNMTEASSGHEGSRKEMVARLQEKLRGVKVLQGR